MSVLPLFLTGLLPVIASTVLVLLIYRRRDKYKKRLVFKSYPPERLIEVSDSIGPQVSIEFQDKTIKELSRFRFSIHNVGRTQITESDIVSPLTLETNRPILSVVKHRESSHLDLSFDPGANSVLIQWKLFNQGCVTMFDVVCDGPADPLETSLAYQIAGIPRIKEETVSKHEIDEANQPRVLKILDWMFFYIPSSLFVVFSFWFWIDSITRNPENLEKYHLLSDITWLGIGIGIIVCLILIVSSLGWIYREFIQRD